MSGTKRKFAFLVGMAALAVLYQTTLWTSSSSTFTASSSSYFKSTAASSSVRCNTGSLDNNGSSSAWSVSTKKDFRKSQRGAESEKERQMLFGGSGAAVPSIDVFWPPDRQAHTPQARFLVDYVVAGFPKCGTTALGTLLSNHPLIKDTANEEHYIQKDTNATIHDLYSSLFLPHNKEKTNLTTTTTTELVRGFRCPHHIQKMSGIRMLAEVFTETKVMVSVRHPILWFQSYYNYRMEWNDTHLLVGSPNDLIGNLEGAFASDVSPWILQTATGEFHRYLSALKKTPMTDPEEIMLLSPFWDRNWNISTLPKTSNPIFLCEISQLGDKNATRQAQFRKDLQQFLGLASEFPEIQKVRPGYSSKVYNEDKKINICDETFSPVREELMNVARHASIWLRKYFMQSEEVYYSSGEFLDESLQKWMDDPCK